jgi:hypothetical protein
LFVTNFVVCCLFVCLFVVVVTFIFLVVVKQKPRFFMLAKAACCFVCTTMLIEKTRLPNFENVIHKTKGNIIHTRMQRWHSNLRISNQIADCSNAHPKHQPT